MADPTPTVIVNDVHVTYQVHGTQGDRGNTATALSRFVQRKASPRVREVKALQGVTFVARRGEAIGSSASTARASPRCCWRSPACCRRPGAASIPSASRRCSVSTPR